MDGNDLWKTYCSFLEKDFSEQVEQNEEQMKKYFQHWKRTKLAKSLMEKTKQDFKNILDVPLTTYEDYPVLHEFGARIEQLTKTNPRRRAERIYNYYSRLFETLKPVLEGWMVNEFSFAAKTSGTSGEPKWIAHGDVCLESVERSTLCMVALACSRGWGETTVKEGEAGLNAGAPVPYASGYGAIAGVKHFKSIPSVEVLDEVTDIRKRMWITLDEIEKGRKPAFGVGVCSFFQLACRWLKNRSGVFKEYYKSLDFGMVKLYMLSKWLQSSLFSKSYEKVRDLMPMKGVVAMGVNVATYKNFFVDEFGIEPLNIYGCTEFIVPMCGPPDKKIYLMPDLRTGYYEFIGGDGAVKNVNELKRGQAYEIVGTPFGSIVFRYRIGDHFTVVDFRDDGMPYFAFRNRSNEALNIYGYFEVTESIFAQVLERAGLKYFEKWTVILGTEPNEHLRVVMEQPWEYSEGKTAELIFEALQQVSTDFQSYMRDFSIRDPAQAIKVEYLKQGAFLRYTMKKAREGVEPGQIKPPKIILPEKLGVLESLK